MRLAAAIVVLAVPCWAQFKSTVPLVVAPTTVTDSKGHYVDGLTPEDLILYDNNVPQAIQMDWMTYPIDLVVAVRRKLHTDAEVAVISGYRTPQTNAMLAAHSDGVAHHSLHMDGMALDWRVPGRTLEQLHRVALAMRGGGVGYYPSSDFVHVDVGRVRYW